MKSTYLDKLLEENLTTEKTTLYIWKCPRDGKIIEGQTKERVRSLVKQHYQMKHDKIEEESERDE